jgi:hypothetical protein
MTAIRKLASQILDVAARYASPEVRDWGTAMGRELDFVESDLAALFWALGSATVLFKHLEVPMSGPSLFERFRTVLAFLWILTTVCMMLFASIKLLYDPTFQLGVGLIQIKGFIGLLTTIPAILCGTVAAVLLWRRRILGARLLTAYCLFWLLSLIGGVVADWRISHTQHVERQFNVLIYGSAGSLVFLVVVASVASMTVWAWHRASEPVQA